MGRYHGREEAAAIHIGHADGPRSPIKGTLCGLPVPAHIEAAAKIHPYNERVFLAPYWGAIFAQDAERKQDRQEAEATGRVMAETYTRLGYQIVELPLVGIEQRADFIAERLQAG